MRRFLPAVAALAAAVFAAPASADTFDVVGRGDSGGGCTAIGVQSFQCASLRDAVTAAATGGPHAVILHAGSPYVLSSGQLSITSGQFVLAGENARLTAIQAGAGARVLELGGAADGHAHERHGAGRQRACRHRREPSRQRGHEAVAVNARVTGGSASAGGGIANAGSLAIVNSLIDSNLAASAGGGILNDGAVGAAAELDVINSTIAFNRVQDGPAPESRPRATRATPSRCPSQPWRATSATGSRVAPLLRRLTPSPRSSRTTVSTATASPSAPRNSISTTRRAVASAR